jgi:hypothetical protein
VRRGGNRAPSGLAARRGRRRGAVGAGDEPDADERVELSGAVVTPGLVNTITTCTRPSRGPRALAGESSSAGSASSTRSGPGIGRRGEYAAARTGLAELALSGCSTVFDTTTSFPRGRPDWSRRRCRRPLRSGAGSSRRAADGPRRVRRRLPPDELVEGHRRGARRHGAARGRAARTGPGARGPDRRRALLTVLRDEASDGRVRRVRRAAWADAPHASCGDGRGGGLLHGAVRRHAGRVSDRSRVARRRCVVRALRAPVSRRHRGLRGVGHGGRALPHVESPGWVQASLPCASTSTPAFASGSASTAPRPTSAATSCTR